MSSKVNQTQLTRRSFLASTSAAAGGLMVSFHVPLAQAATAPGVPEINAWVVIKPDDSVVIRIARSEMGQGVRTSMPMIVADELEADWARVRVVQAPGDEKRYGNQDTDGSRSTRHFFQPMRTCGAAARMMLEQAAAERWKVPVSFQ